MRDGLLVVDKPAAWTSHDVVAKLRGVYGQRRVGHAGTLDPDATGVLLVGLGRATRLLRFLQEAGKAYRGTVVFGVATSTLDASGDVLEQQPMALDREQVEAATTQFLGEIEQLPPMVSAVKIGGRRLHQLAREGIDVERAPRPVRIDRFDVEAFVPGPYPQATVVVECGSGTYIRSLAADLGVALGGCAHLGELRRLRVGSFTLDEARSLDDVIASPDDAVLPLTTMVRDLPRADLDREQARGGVARHGVPGGRARRASTTPPSRWHWSTASRASSSRCTSAGVQRASRAWSSGDGGDRVMQIVEELSALRSERGAVVTIGVYDGVHLGHQSVLRLVRELADARGLDAVCITFDRHPAEVVRPESAPKLLTNTEQKLELLAETGYLDRCFVLHFDQARSTEPAEEFVREVLVDSANARVVVVGADFHFGKNRGGSVALLEQMGADLGFEVIGVGLVAAAPGGPVYSSTRIRELLAEGDVEAAAALLGRPHEVRGTIEHGDERGRELGFPTANVAVPERVCLPADGVFAGTFTAGDGQPRVAAISLGRRPTFYEESGMLLLEAHVLDFAGDLYDQPASVRFLTRIRGQERFDTVEELVARMELDVAETRRRASWS